MLARSLCVWLPILGLALALTAIARKITYGAHGHLGVPFILGLLLILIADAFIIYAVMRPTASVADRLAGTRLVPV